MDEFEHLDEAILQHLAANGRDHPQSSTTIRRLATQCLQSIRPSQVRQSTPASLITLRMKLLRQAGRYVWLNKGGRYDVQPPMNTEP